VPGAAARGNEEFRSNESPGMLLDYRRYRRDAIAGFSGAQVAALRDARVVGRITTNAPGGFWAKAMDHNAIFAPMDLAAYDNYPVWGGSLAPTAPSAVALALDTVRGWKAGGAAARGGGGDNNASGGGGDASANSNGGWMVAEQLIGAQGHDILGYTPRPRQVGGSLAMGVFLGVFQTFVSSKRYRGTFL
jgi:beta-galactosidase